MKPCLVLDDYLEAPGAADNFRRHLEGPVEVVRPPHEDVPHSSAAYRALLVSGSAASVLDDRPWIEPLVALVRDALERGTPVLGVCFGHQILAAARHGRAAVRRAGRPELGWTSIEVVARDRLLAGLEAGFTTFVSHEDEVRPGLAGLEVLARSADCAVQAFRVAGRPAWGVQFHAEMLRPEIEDLVRSKAARRPELGIDPDRVLAGWADSGEIARRLFRNFLSLVQEGSPPCAVG